MKHIELFAGIGGFRKAMEGIENDFSIPFKCLGFSEIDANASKTYKANYDTSNEVEMGDIVAFNSDMSRYDNMDFDLLTGGFPCQAFSMMGKQLGFNDHRGTMFFQIEKIIEKKRPRFVLLENVKNLLTHDKGQTFKEIVARLHSLGYKVFYDIFNTMDYSLAQKRSRLIVFATTSDLPSDFVFNNESVHEVFTANIENFKSLLIQSSVLDVLSRTVPQKYYLSERIKPTLLADGSKNFVSKSEINQIIARPLTATMHKMHRACQDNYYSDGFILADDPVEYLEQKFSKEELAAQPIRKLTPQEAFALQGFPPEFVANAQTNKVCDGALYKQAGNAVSVNVIYAVLYYLFVHMKLK
ncbi:DNA (cytosine-5-)-methyltransferase [uncultured Bacteroides sp.]|uniref:DNA (cytosine-5-)-methyltransferase n=1 Tax=uncultured Bacteroides sp. TaxID=162156 RepID=UPI002594A12D|nr:DNA (cytosine-5-)-methyltransferase [uncultured Bacteroides sp.]